MEQETFDALVFGLYNEGNKFDLRRANAQWFHTVTRAQLFKKFKGLEIAECPFANLPEAKSGRWGRGFTKAKMAECVWLKPVFISHFEFLEWTGENHLRHSKIHRATGGQDRQRRSPPNENQCSSSLAREFGSSATRRRSPRTPPAPRPATCKGLPSVATL